MAEISEDTMHQLLAQLASVRIEQDRVTAQLQAQSVELVAIRQQVIELQSVE